MTIYVDEYRDYPKGTWCHLATDNLDDPHELHAFAAGIGLRRSWFKDHITHPHYDLKQGKYDWRAKAIAAGAVPVTPQELVKRCSKYFRVTPEKQLESIRTYANHLQTKIVQTQKYLDQGADDIMGEDDQSLMELEQKTRLKTLREVHRDLTSILNNTNILPSQTYHVTRTIGTNPADGTWHYIIRDAVTEDVIKHESGFVSRDLAIYAMRSFLSDQPYSFDITQDNF